MMGEAILPSLVPDGVLDSGITYALAVIVVGLFSALFVKRKAITVDYAKSERAQLSEDTQWIIDTLRKRYDDLDAEYVEKVGALREQLQNLAVQYAAAIAENGELQAKMTVHEARVHTLETELRRVRLDYQQHESNGSEGRGGSIRQEE